MHEDAGREWTLEELSGTPEDRARIEREACEADLTLLRWLRWLHAEAVHNLARERASRQAWAAEAEHRRREAEFEAKGERWDNAIVGRTGHELARKEYGYRCHCGAEVWTLRAWAEHIAATRMAEGVPLCACVTDEQADQLTDAGFTRPVCAVHPEVTDNA